MTTKEFIQYASERPELCDKMSVTKTAEEGYAIAKAEGLTDDMDTFVQVMTETKKEIEALNDDDLTNISAAATTGTIVATCTAVSGAVAMGASLAI